MNKKIIIVLFCVIATFPANSQEILTLEKCKELTLKNSRQIQNAALSLAIAQEQKKEAFTNYFPNISATGLGFAANKPMLSMEMDLSGITDAITPLMGWLMQQGAPLDPSALAGLSQPQKVEALNNGVIGGITATQPVFVGGQVINGNRLAKAGIEIRQLQQQVTEKEVLLETERYFWQLVALNEKMKTIENSEAMLNQILSDVRVAIQAGLTTRNDLLRVELEQNKLESGKLKAQNGLMMLKITLGQKIGVPADSFDIQQPDFSEILPAFSKSDSGALQRRPEYQLLEKSVDIARLQHDMEVGKKLPTIAVGAGYNYMNFDKNKDNPFKNDFGMLFATVSIPISDWWGGSHAIKQKKFELQRAENIKQENSELLLQQMQNVQNGLNEAYLQVALARKSISSAEENLKISQDNYNAGVIALSDLLEAQNLLQQSNDQYTEAATDYFVKLAEYRQVNE